MLKFKCNILREVKTVQDRLNIEREKINDIDRKIARLFSQRMECSANIAKIKSSSGLPIYDKKRESEVIEKESELVSPQLVGYYKKVLSCLMSVSKAYQSDILKDSHTVCVTTQLGAYDIKIKRSGISEVGKFFDLDRKVLVVTDSGVPSEYAEAVASQCKQPTVITIPQGEKSKSIETFCDLEKAMLDNDFSRNDCVVAVGGGVVGDVCAFAASAYMRGIDFYNVPTTLLSQVDSSVGGKSAVNFGAVKNSVGAFKQPNGVLIDPNLLSSLDKRQISNGLAECIKTALICDSELLDIIENDESLEQLDKIILRCVQAKKAIVEQDEQESGLRRALNFGHTTGHAIEVESGLLHGESVALGMLPMVSPSIRQRLIPLYERLALPIKYEIGESFSKSVSHDKKADSGKITAVTVNEIGTFTFTEMTVNEIEQRAREVLSK